MWSGVSWKLYIFAAKMKWTEIQTKYPDAEASQTIGLLRWVLMALIVVVHTNLVADTGCTDTVYGNLYRWAGNVVWLASPLFFLISGYLFVASDSGFSWQAFTVKCCRRWRTWVIPYLLWNTLFLLFYGLVGLLFPSVLGDTPPLQEMTLTDVLKSYWCIRGEGFNSGPIDGPLWFLRDLMVIALFTPLYVAFLRWHKATVLIPILLGFLPHQLGFESEIAFFMIGIWLNVWMPSLSELLRKPIWQPLPYYLVGSVLVTVPGLVPEWSIAAMTFVRNLSGMLVVARICYRVTLRHPERDWRAMAEPVFFVFAFHSMVARPLTKLSASWLLSHDAGSLAFLATHFVNAIVTIVITLLIYSLLRRVMPTVCGWLSATPPSLKPNN
jgi:surface polysaccharide O-acyltransferase-like enzyme